MRFLLIFSALIVGTAQAQFSVEPDPHSIVVSVSKTIIVAPTDAVFLVTVFADPATPLSQVVTAVGFNLTADDLSAIYSAAPPGPSPSPNAPPSQTKIQYTFRLAVPIAQMIDTIGKLQSLVASKPDMFASYFSQQIGPNQAAADKAQEAALPDLIARAQKLAASVAAAAQLKLGRIQAVNPNTPGSASPPGTLGSVITISAAVRFAAL